MIKVIESLTKIKNIVEVLKNLYMVEYKIKAQSQNTGSGPNFRTTRVKKSEVVLN